MQSQIIKENWDIKTYYSKFCIFFPQIKILSSSSKFITILTFINQLHCRRKWGNKIQGLHIFHWILLQIKYSSDAHINFIWRLESDRNNHQYSRSYLYSPGKSPIENTQGFSVCSLNKSPHEAAAHRSPISNKHKINIFYRANLIWTSFV